MHEITLPIRIQSETPYSLTLVRSIIRVIHQVLHDNNELFAPNWNLSLEPLINMNPPVPEYTLFREGFQVETVDQFRKHIWDDVDGETAIKLLKHTTDFPGTFIIWDRHEPFEGLCMTGDDRDALMQQAIEHLELHK